MNKSAERKTEAIWIGILISLSWFFLAFISSAPIYFITRYRGTFIPGSGGIEYDAGTHIMRLMMGMALVLVIAPILLKRTYKEGYRSYLSSIGMFFPKKKNEKIALAVFWISLAGLFVLELADENLITELEAFQNRPLWLIILAGLQAAFVEETIFRGLAYDVIDRKYSFWYAMIIPAVIFGFAHVWWGLGRVATTALMGILFAMLRKLTGNVWGSVGMHFLIALGTPIPAWGSWIVTIFVGVVMIGMKRVKAHSEHEAK